MEFAACGFRQHGGIILYGGDSLRTGVDRIMMHINALCPTVL